MNDLISPKYQMKLINEVENALWAEFQTSKYVNVKYYIQKWQYIVCEDSYNGIIYNFDIVNQPNSTNIDLSTTLHNIDGATLLKIAIDLGIDTPDFIPSIPTFKNTLKSDYKTAYDTFVKAYKQIETDPSIAVGLANSALESIIKEILKDNRLNCNLKGNETNRELTKHILKQFKLFSKSDLPDEIKTIGHSLSAINQSIEDLRSSKTDFHGKTAEDYIIDDPIYAYFVVNSITTVGLFLNSYYKNKFPKIETEIANTIIDDDFPF
jgi:hypothetical protein